MTAHLSNGRTSASALDSVLLDQAPAPTWVTALKQGAAPGPLAAAADPSGPQAFAGTGGPVVGFSTRIGSEILTNTATVGGQTQYQMTMLSNGGFVVTWMDASVGDGGATGDASGNAIKAQVFDAFGAMVGTEILVNTATTSSQSGAQITALSAGGFVVTWQDLSLGVGGATGDASGNAVKAQVFNAAGAMVGTEILVNTATTNSQSVAQITALSDGGFVVTWLDSSTGVGGATGDASGFAVKAQVFDAAGAMVGTEILVNTATANNQSAPKIAALSDGGFVVTWQDFSAGVGGATGDASSGAIKAQVFNAAGAMVGTEILVNTATANNQQTSQITALTNGGFVVTWQDSSFGVGGATGDASGNAVKAQVFNAAGAKVGTEILVNTATTTHQSAPQITALSDGGFVVTWTDASAGVGGATGDTSGNAVKAQVFNAAGAKVGSEILVNTATANAQQLAQITALSDGAFAITWQDSSLGVGGATGDASGPAIKTQIFRGTQWAVEQIPLDLQYIGFTLSDPDAADVLTVTLSTDYGILTLDSSELSIGVDGSGTATLTLTGTAAEIGQVIGDGAWGGLLTFTANTDTPPALATLTLTADDGAGGVAVTSAPILITGTFDLAAATAGADAITGSAANETINGLDGDDTLDGGGGNDTLTGGAGLDSLIGGDGVDTARYFGNAVGVDANLGRGDAREAGVIVDTFSGIENLTGSAFNDVLIGNAGANYLDGGTGTDVLIGQGGDDLLFGGTGAPNELYGGLGDDTYFVGANDTVIENAGEGTDTVSTVPETYVLRANVENLTYTGFVNFHGTGNASDNVLTSRTGADVLIGRGGNDVLNGGNGIDRADYALAATGVTASLTLGTASDDGDGGSDVLNGIENLGGSAFNDTLTGGAGVNVLTGGYGDDVLQGRGGNDQLFGGPGSDTASWADAGAAVTVRLNANSASDGEGGTDTLNAIEHATGSAFNDLLVGNAVDNTLRGGLGRDTLLGQAGNDVLIGGSGAANQMQGGLGDDWYVVEAVGDTVIELAGEGTDRVETTLDRYTLRAHIEDLSYAGSGNFTGVGNTSNNVITGGTGNDTLTGGQGDDTLNGFAGDDTVVLSGLFADYLIVDRGDGSFDVTDSVGGRDGVDRLIGIDHIRFANGQVIDVVAAPAPAPIVSAKDAGPQTLPGLSGDGFLLDGDADLPLVLPAMDDPSAEARGFDGLAARLDGFMLTLGEDRNPLQWHGFEGSRGDDGWAF